MQATGEDHDGRGPEGGPGATPDDHRFFARAVRWISWLRASPRLAVTLTVAGIAASFALDLLIPGYAIVGFYLAPILLAAFVLPGRAAALVGVLSLGLAIFVMIIQDRIHAQNILLLWFAVVAAAGLFALGYLYNRFDQLYESERRTTSRLHVLTAQLRALQEKAVLDQPSEPDVLLAQVAELALQLLGSDRCVVYGLDGDGDSLAPKAKAGARPQEPGDDGRALRAAADRAVDRRRAVVEGACLAVPLVVRDEVFGAIVFSDRDRHAYHDEDISIATTFGDQVALAVENARLRERVVRTAAAAERTRLARELHDSVTQSLFAASLKADVVAETSVATTPRLAQALEDLQRLTRGALAEMRTMLLEMRPDALVRAPLGELLRHLAEAAQSRARIAVDLSVSSRRPLPEEVHVTFYRVAQEALNNVVRHAAASSVRIELIVAETAVLTVTDDGEGFDPALVSPERLGIVSMRERAAAVGADFTIETAPGRGTVVTLEWPNDEKGRSADG